MTAMDAQEHARKLGMSAWQCEVIKVGPHGSETGLVCCVGFERIELPVAEADSWEEALAEVMRIVFAA